MNCNCAEGLANDIRRHLEQLDAEQHGLEASREWRERLHAAEKSVNRLQGVLGMKSIDAQNGQSTTDTDIAKRMQEIAAEREEALADYEITGCSCVRFPDDEEETGS
jgi:hypothetical protein